MPHREYDKYNQGDIHWQWYHNLPSYFDLVNYTLAPFKAAELGTMVDVGAGDGLPLSFLDKWGFKCAAVEPSYEGVDLAMKHNVSAEFFVEKAEKFAEREMDFDYLYSLNTIEHLDEPKAMVAIMRRIRRFGIIVTDNDETSDPVKRSQYHEMQFTPATFEALFAEFNFEQLQLPSICSSFMAYKIWKKI